ncbi:eukaryotic translation initiation factor 4E-binding protein Mextli isoform X2 [Condylostylus longicornis]|uniref:eukaryotic translation initiation factor 4E-binding protein Mextli isoform X2 n=1 Tax=Condylostylus longicornis TaxID=2530218 RepID=UPI00244DAEDF|nr:eukaryotic translation initiation factor 4E-binding protein Mextli isoform X2 [Condylostylus longicornis]
MSQVGRSVKNLEAPRPLKSQSRSNIVKSNYIVIEELIQLIETVAATLASGISNQEAMLLLVQNLRLHGPQMESVSKDTLDRAFVTFRNASQDERLNIMTRLNLLELIELRAKSWKDDGANTYYKAKATNVEPENITGTIIDQSSIMSTSPQSLVTASTGNVNLTGGGGQLQQQHQQHQQLQHNQINQTGVTLLGPGEVIRNSGKFSKPTKIPGKNYSKDEVVIRNADSGKVMGIKGRRVHMIEELSETIISFQRVNPGAKERLVQITGPSEEKINYAKQLIEDTIRRNASPVRLEPITNQNTGTEGAGSCSSLASSNSDEVNMRSGVTGHHLNRNSIGAVISNVNFVQPGLNSVVMPNMIGTSNIVSQSNMNKRSNAAGGNNSGQQPLLHSFSTNDATLGEYKYTVNVGHHIIKITGDNCELVRAAKLVLDDYFSSNEFLASVEAGAAFDNVMINSTSTPTTPLTGGPTFAPQSHQLISSTPFADSGIGLNYMAGQISGNSYVEGDDDVFIIEENGTPTPVNGLSRSRRSHFSRKDSTPPDSTKSKTTEATKKEESNTRIVHEYERLIYYAKSPHSWALPRDWQKIVDKHPSLIRNKDINDESQRFDADKYLQMIKTNGKRTIVIDDVAIDVEAQEND